MIKPEDVLNFASKLVASSQPSELDARQAAARAYYSVFLLIRDGLGVQTEKGAGPVHELVRKTLRDLRLSTGRLKPHEQLALDFWQSMYDDRTTADYRINQSFAVAKGKLAVERASRIFAQLAK